MRNIRFRGKRIDNGEWVYGYYCFIGYTNQQKHYIIPDYASAFYGFEVDPATVGQYIGFKDRNGNGREMYEDDVYKSDNRHYLIEWSKNQCGWVARSLKSGAVLPNYLQGEIAVYDDYEYIGSIHDNPELLEG